MSTLIHPLQHISGKNHDRRLRRSWRHCQLWRQNSHQPLLCWWHHWLSRRGRRTGKAFTAYGMEISAEKTKLMTSNTSGINTEIKVNGQKLETDTSFKYLGSVIADWGSKPEILSSIAQTTAALTRLKPVWNDRSIFLSSKIQLMCSLVTSIFLYACASLTLTADLQRRKQATEIRCYCKILCILYKDPVTNDKVCAKIQQAIIPHEDLLTIVKRRKLQWYGHVPHSSGLAETILQGTMKGGRRGGKTALGNG